MPVMTTKRALLLALTISSLTAFGCSSEEGIDDLEMAGHVGSVEQAGSTGDSWDYVHLGNAWGYRRWSSAGIHKIECMWTNSAYRSTYQGWSNTAHCSNNLRTSWYPTCSGNQVSGHNPDHGSSDHYFYSAGAAHDAANTHEGSCSYSWWSTCNSKDWMEHFVDAYNPYTEDGH